jgi:hypothetical protein
MKRLQSVVNNYIKNARKPYISTFSRCCGKSIQYRTVRPVLLLYRNDFRQSVKKPYISTFSDVLE